MADNIFSSSDDDIFEDYVDTSFDNSILENTSDNTESLNTIFSDVDSPFAKLMENSSLRINIGEAFYSAADEWVNNGYKEANAAAIIKQIVKLTNGRFLYDHRLECSKEVIARKKTIIKFLNILIDKEQEKSIVDQTSRILKLNLSESYFDIFFRSYYNIEMFMVQHEIALYKALCDMMGEEIDHNLCDLNHETDTIQNTADVINDLYMQYFDKDDLEERMKQYVDEFRAKEA